VHKRSDLGRIERDEQLFPFLHDRTSILFMIHLPDNMFDGNSHSPPARREYRFAFLAGPIAHA
jgi:hypothetical protein